jgi:hypothetical protein
MATSNSTDWSLNRDQVITGALRKLAVIPSGATPTANQISDAAEALNGLVKAFQADGMPLWKVASQTFTVVDGTNSYTVGPSQTINCPKPLRIIQATYTLSGGTNAPMNVYNRYDFNLLPTTAEGAPINLYYQPLSTTGIIKLWPTPDNSTTTISFNYISPFEDMDNASNDFDFPSEWITPLIFNLAWVLAPEYGIPPLDRDRLEKEANYWHQYVLGMGSEEGGIFFQPDNTWR